MGISKEIEVTTISDDEGMILKIKATIALQYHRGVSRGRVQGVRTPPRDDLRFSNTTGILQKKKLCGLLVLK